MEPRPIASGTISFGLVVIPVKLFTAGETSKSVRFHHVHKACGTRVKYRYYCPTDDQIVERSELAKGYEVAKGQYVLFSPEELKALNPEATHAIEIAEFVPAEAVDPLYYEKAYFLGPDKGGAKPYRLLAEAMAETGRVALARYAARGKDYLVLLRPVGDTFVMHQLRFADELRDVSEVPVGDPGEPRRAELDLALQLIESRSSETFRPEQYEDEVTRELWRLVERKVQGEEIVSAPEEETKAPVLDLMEALKASLAESAEGDAAEAGKKPAKKRRPRRKAS